MVRISSRQNAIVKRFRDVRRGDQPHLMLLDGEHLLREAIASGIQISAAAFADGAAADELMRGVQQKGAEVFTVNGQVLAALSPVREPSGVVAIAAKPRATVHDVLAAPAPAKPENGVGSEIRQPLVVMLSDVQDPGNIGAVIRAAEGCSATGVICSEATADPFGWKALRGAMGSTFRLPVVSKQPLAAAIASARASGLQVFATTARGGTPLPDCNLRKPSAILFGSEGHGLADDLIAAADERMTIPMQHPVESLNVAVAAALVVYEATRQRRAPHR